MMTSGGFSDKILEELSARALSDSDPDCRSEAINMFLRLLEIEDRDPSLKERYRVRVEAMVKENFCEGIQDDNWKVRQSWIKLAGTQVEKGEGTHIAEPNTV
jgi:hypothetical protein